MFEKEKRMMVFLSISLLFAVVITVIIACYSGIRIGEADILAFLGSIIGGVITLAGVYFTIISSFKSVELSLREQERNRFINSYPTKIKNLREIISEINQIRTDLSESNLTGLRDITKKLEPLIDKAVYVDGIVYENVNRMNRYVKSYLVPRFEWENSIYLIDKWGNVKIKEGQEDASLETIEHLKQYLATNVQELQQHRERMRDTFYDYIK
jgi:hypothetical protein